MKYYLLEDKYPISFCDLNNVVSTGLKLLNKNKFGLLEKDPYKIKTSKHHYFWHFVHFLFGFDMSAPVVGSSSIPNGVIFLGSGVNVDSGLSS